MKKKSNKCDFTFFALNVYSQDSLKWNFKYSGYVDLKTIKLPSGYK